jgi:hypothetical protein
MMMVLMRSQAPLAAGRISNAASPKFVEQSNTVVAQRFVLVDQQGKKLAALEVPHIEAFKNSAKFKKLPSKSQAEALALAENRNYLAGPSLILYDSRLRRASFDLDDEGTPAIHMFDSAGRNAVELEGGRGASLNLYDEVGKSAIWLGSTGTEDAALTISDDNGKTEIALGVYDNGEPGSIFMTKKLSKL